MKKLLGVIVSILAILVFIGCTSNKENDVAPTKLTIDGARTEMNVGDVVTLNVKFSPAETTLKDVEWTSSDPQVLKITVGNKVTCEALKAGQAIITVKSTKSEAQATIKITVVEEEDVNPTPIEFVNARTSVTLGEFTLDLKFVPSNTTNKEVEWKSSDESIIKITNGILNAVDYGDATITVTSKADSNVSTSILISVIDVILPEVIATDFSLITQATVFVVNNTFKYTAYAVPQGAEMSCVWSSSNTDVATVDNSGRITCLAPGTTVITCTDIYSNITKEVEIEVVDTPALTGMTLSDRTIKKGENAILKVIPEPEFAIANVTWSSSQPGVATIDSEGKVTGVEIGETIITATDESGITATCKITVEKEFSDDPESIVLTTTFAEVTLGYPVKFAAQVLPSGVNQSVVWSSNNEGVGTIDNQGLFTPVAEGTTRIRATSAVNPDIKSSYFSVKVIAPAVVDIPNLNGYEIVVMNAESALHEQDPFLEKYSGMDKSYKQEAWRKIESDYNCKIVVKAYPSDAPWGPTRITWINNNAQNKTTPCDFGVLACQWIPQFVSSSFSALVDTSDFFFKYGNNQVEPALYDAASYAGKYYAVSIGLTVRTYPIQGLFYNYGLVQKLNLESPAKLFNEGKWTYSDFEQWCIEAQSRMEEGEYVIAGSAPLAWQGMVNAAGVKLADTTTLELNIKHKYSYEASSVMASLYEKGCWDPNFLTTEDAAVTTFQTGKAIFQPAQYWFVRADNRFPAKLWGEGSTFYGYVPYPYPNDVAKENTRTNFVGDSAWLMVAGKQKPAGITEEMVYQAVQDMYLTTIKMQKSDPLFNESSILRAATQKRIDDPESVEATLFFTAEKTMFDPYFDDSFQYSYSGDTARAVVAIIKGADPAEEFEAIYNVVDTAFKRVFAN